MPLLPPRMRHRATFALLALVAIAGRSEGMPLHGDLRGDSLCARPPAAHDSVRVVVTAIARVDSVNVDHPAKLSPQFLTFVVEAVRTHFVPPTNLDLASMALGMPRPPAEWLPPPTITERRDSTTTPSLAVDAYFDINASGTPGDIRVGRSTMAGGLARSVESAIRAIVPEDYGLIPKGADGTRIHLRVDVAPASVAIEQPFFTAWLPVYHIDQYPDVKRPSVLPEYPGELRSMGISDTVRVAFAIGADGHVIPKSVDVLAARFRGFAEAAIYALSRDSFQPLVADGCPLTSTVQQTSTFTINR